MSQWFQASKVNLVLAVCVVTAAVPRPHPPSISRRARLRAIAHTGRDKGTFPSRDKLLCEGMQELVLDSGGGRPTNRRDSPGVGGALTGEFLLCHHTLKSMDLGNMACVTHTHATHAREHDSSLAAHKSRRNQGARTAVQRRACRPSRRRTLTSPPPGGVRKNSTCRPLPGGCDDASVRNARQAGGALAPRG
jgi:hypothetical protein